MKRNSLLLFAVLCLFAAPWPMAQQQQQREPQRQAPPPPQQPQLHEEVTVRWWLVPVYAVDKAGAPVLNLAPDDLDVYIKNIKVEQFTLHKKTFKVTETKEAVVSAPKPTPQQPPAAPQKKMIFLIFDAASTPAARLAKAKMICDSLLAQSNESAQYVLLSIEPHGGLHYFCGPTRDRQLISQQIKKFISGKKSEYLRSLALSQKGGVSGLEMSVYKRADLQAKYQETIGFSSSIKTLCLIMGYFPQYSKVVYLYSCRVPWESFNDASVPGGFDQNPIANKDLDFLSTLAKALNKTGAFLFMINPVNDIDLTPEEQWDNAGKDNLQSLASESGGRYIAGEEKKIIEQVTNMEGGYYEVSFPDKPEYEGQELSFEIRSKKPEVRIYTLKNVGREKSFADMSDRERELLVLNILNNGPNALTTQKVSYVDNSASQESETLVCRLTLPPDLARSDWVVYKVARNFETGDHQIETERIVSESANCEVKMKWRGAGYRYDIVLVHLKTGTILVAK